MAISINNNNYNNNKNHNNKNHNNQNNNNNNKNNKSVFYLQDSPPLYLSSHSSSSVLPLMFLQHIKNPPPLNYEGEGKEEDDFAFRFSNNNRNNRYVYT